MKWERCNVHYAMSVGQEKYLSFQQEMNLWPSVHWSHAITTELRVWEICGRARPYTWFYHDTCPSYCYDQLFQKHHVRCSTCKKRLYILSSVIKCHECGTKKTSEKPHSERNSVHAPCPSFLLTCPKYLTDMLLLLASLWVKITITW